MQINIDLAFLIYAGLFLVSLFILRQALQLDLKPIKKFKKKLRKYYVKHFCRRRVQFAPPEQLQEEYVIPSRDACRFNSNLYVCFLSGRLQSAFSQWKSEIHFLRSLYAYHQTVARTYATARTHPAIITLSYSESCPVLASPGRDPSESIESVDSEVVFGNQAMMNDVGSKSVSDIGDFGGPTTTARLSPGMDDAYGRPSYYDVDANRLLDPAVGHRNAARNVRCGTQNGQPFEDTFCSVCNAHGGRSRCILVDLPHCFPFAGTRPPSPTNRIEDGSREDMLQCLIGLCDNALKEVLLIEDEAFRSLESIRIRSDKNHISDVASFTGLLLQNQLPDELYESELFYQLWFQARCEHFLESSRLRHMTDDAMFASLNSGCQFLYQSQGRVPAAIKQIGYFSNVLNICGLVADLPAVSVSDFHRI